MKSVLNFLIVGTILLILYVFIGHDFVMFYFDGEAKMLASAKQINSTCNEYKSCPTAIPGWQASGSNSAALRKGNMLYFVGEGDKAGNHPTFRLVYSFAMPDDWFEAQGGVGREVTSGWKSR